MNNAHLYFGLFSVVLFGLSIVFVSPSTHAADSTEVEQAMSVLRENYSQRGFRNHQLGAVEEDVETCLGLLDQDGGFRDLRQQEVGFRKDGSYEIASHARQRKLEHISAISWNRIWKIADSFRGKPADYEPEAKRKLLRAIAHYADWETARPDGRFRFHISCFATPTAAGNTYFALMPLMEAIESGDETDPEAVAAYRGLRAVAMQAWTQPKREDETDKNPVQIERFRHHVWWVGGNGLTYRPVFQTAVMLNRPDMIDVLVEVAHRAISTTTYNTWDTAFWEENMTADGLGWGHGRQSLVFGYPFHGTSAALAIIVQLRGTPWERPLSEEAVSWLINLLRGSSWTWYRDYLPPMFDRNNMSYAQSTQPRDHAGKKLAEFLLHSFDESLSDQQRRELTWYASNAAIGGQFTNNPPVPDQYTGVRYFWNNDLLAVKNPRWHLLVNMSSARTHGLESAYPFAAGYNFFTTDGQAIFQRSGNAHGRALGASDLTQLPGITAREEVRPLQPVTNWSGYPSKHPLTGGVASGDDGCAGFVFEKTNAHTNSADFEGEANPGIYGVVATKSYFVLGDTVVALGAGVRDKHFEKFGGRIRTSVEQIVWSSDVTVTDATGSQTVTYTNRPEPFHLEADMPDSSEVTLQVHHDGFTYAVLPEQTDGRVELTLERRDADWKRLSDVNAKTETPTAENMLQISIDHGEDPENASYGYVVRFDESRREIASDQMPVVLANTPELQAVSAPDGRIMQALFFSERARLDSGGWEVSVSAPAVVMFQATDRGWLITASDLLQSPKPSPLRVKVKHQDGGQTRSGRATLELPQIPWTGSQAQQEIVLR